MLSWFQRGEKGPEQPAAPEPDSPEALTAQLVDLVRYINTSSGRLPVAAVVLARRVTDTVSDILLTMADDAVPDVQAVLSVRGILGDYLPTTLERFLALDAATADLRLANGRTSKEQVVSQLAELLGAATDVLEATRSQDANDLITQGNFLRTKFSRSDLDL